MQKPLSLLFAAAAIALLGLPPILAMIAKSLYLETGFSLKAYQSLLGTAWQPMLLMTRSLACALLTTVLAVIVGVPLGVLLAKTDLPFRRPLTVFLAVPLMVPPYIIALGWLKVLGKAGWIGSELAAAALGKLTSLYFGLYGCAWVLFTALMPIVMLLTMVYLQVIPARWEQAARLVSRWPLVLRGISLPFVGPGILFAGALVFLLALGEVGVPTLLRYPVYPVETLIQFAAFYDFAGATAAAVPMLLVTALLLLLEYCFLQDRVLALTSTAPASGQMRIGLGRWRGPLAVMVGGLAVIITIVPLAALFEGFSLSAFGEAWSRAGDSILRSISYSIVGATVLTTLGFFCGYLIFDRTFPLWRFIDVLTVFLFTLPGTVIGIGLISIWNRPQTSAIYAGPAIIILGYVAQYALLPTRITSATLARIPRSFEQAARLAGASWWTSLIEVVAPLARPGLVASWLIAYIFCMRDLGISIIVYPPGSDTLPVRILTLMANGAPSLIAALCIIAILLALLPLGLAIAFQKLIPPAS